MSDTSSALLAPLDRQARLGDLAYNALKDRLVTGGFAPGDKLTVRAVAEALKVSTTPARDAINRLIADGNLVNAGPKTVVVPFLDTRVLDEITTMRFALEGVAAERGAPNVTRADIETLEKLQAKINVGLDASQYSDVLKHNRDFHFLIYERSQMPRLVATIEISVAADRAVAELPVSTFRHHAPRRLQPHEGHQGLEGEECRDGAHRDGERHPRRLRATVAIYVGACSRGSGGIGWPTGPQNGGTFTDRVLEGKQLHMIWHKHRERRLHLEAKRAHLTG